MSTFDIFSKCAPKGGKSLTMATPVSNTYRYKKKEKVAMKNVFVDINVALFFVQSYQICDEPVRVELDKPEGLGVVERAGVGIVEVDHHRIRIQGH